MALDADSSGTFKTGSKHVVFAGTRVLAGTAEALVVATAVNTAKGKLLASVLFPTLMMFKYDEEYPIAYFFLHSFAFVAFVASVMAVGFAGSCSQVRPASYPYF
jgi:magnesium-transporting ATPase (P-type)